MPTKILVVDDREAIRTFIVGALAAVGHEVAAAEDGQAATGMLEGERFDLVITDLKMPRVDGMELLARARSIDPSLPVIILTAHGTIDNAVEAMKLGAFDYLTKPLEGPAQLRRVVERALEQRGLVGGGGRSEDLEMVAADPAMVEIAGLIERVAPTDTTVLLSGESGTGKEVAAREIHRRSGRSEAPFVAVNCAAVSPQLVESEMFGHEKGAFTGAEERRPGRFESADGGTLFLDEVGELPPGLQAKLLRVLQERSFERVGGTETIEVDVRIIAATNRDLPGRIEAGEFREDLYHRLSVFPLELPPLRERPGDLAPLTDRLLGEIGRRLGRPALRLDDGALAALAAHSWPGNVRELGNVLERAAILADGDVLGASSFDLSSARAADTDVAQEGAGTLKEMEREAIRAALTRTDGHRKNAAEILGIGLRTLYKKIKEYGLD